MPDLSFDGGAVNKQLRKSSLGNLLSEVHSHADAAVGCVRDVRQIYVGFAEPTLGSCL